MAVIKKVIGVLGKFIRGVMSIFITLIVIGVCLFTYARYIEPELLVVKTRNIKTDAVKLGDKAIKIVQLSDLHLGEDYTTDNLRKVVNKVNELEPDIIVYTGDLIDDNKTFKDTNETVEVLATLQAPLGKYAVYGNHDYGANGHKKYKFIMNESGFKLLINESSNIKLESGEVIQIIGIDDLIFGKANVEKAFEEIGENQLNIVLVHEPDIADLVAQYPIDLQLSGHSHGGQVRFPFIGAPYTPRYSEKYIKGMYSFETNKRMKLYVNVGIGTSQARFRFLNMPEITLFVVENK